MVAMFKLALLSAVLALLGATAASNTSTLARSVRAAEYNCENRNYIKPNGGYLWSSKHCQKHADAINKVRGVAWPRAIFIDVLVHVARASFFLFFALAKPGLTNGRVCLRLC